MPGMGDHPTATGLYAAIVTALYRREKKTGRAASRKPPCCRTALGHGCYVQNRCSASTSSTGPPRADTPSALANHYRCRDGRWF